MEMRVLKRLPFGRLMDLKVDYAFKQLFGSEKNKEITIVFLNAILKRTGRDGIKDISFRNTEAGGEYEDDKQSRLDLLVVTNAGEWINVEIQFTNKYDMINRSIYYWAGAYRSPMKSKMAYTELRPVIAVNILNFNIFDLTEQFHTTYHLYEDKEKFKLTDTMELHFIEMSKLIRDWKAEKLNPWDDILARWLLLLGVVDRRKGKVYDDIFKELEEIAMKDDTLRSAFQSWEVLSHTEEEVLAYEARLKRVLDEEAFLRETELRVQKAHRELEEARKEARKEVQEARKEVQEAREEARKEARKEAQKARQREKEITARRLLAKEMDLDDIVEITGLNEKRIIEIQQDMKN